MRKPALPDSPSGRLGRYFKYAIGEILLVVIGILIALAINNWNEDRKAKKNEIVLLEKLKTENKLNLEILAEDELYRKKLGSIYTKYIEYLSSSKQKSADSLEYFLSETLRTTSYTFTQNNLVNFINNQRNYFSELNKEISFLENIQNDLVQVSAKALEPKVNYYYKALENEVDFTTGDIYSMDTMTSLAFRNNLLLVNSVDLEISRKYFEALEQMRKVDSLLTNILGDG